MTRSITNKYRPLMANLNKLADERIAELMTDERVLLRALGEKVSEIVLTEQQRGTFEEMLSAAGYPKELIHGADAVLIGQAKKMAAEVADAKIEEFKKEDAAAPVGKAHGRGPRGGPRGPQR